MSLCRVVFVGSKRFSIIITVIIIIIIIINIIVISIIIIIIVLILHTLSFPSYLQFQFVPLNASSDIEINYGQSLKYSL